MRTSPAIVKTVLGVLLGLSILLGSCQRSTRRPTARASEGWRSPNGRLQLSFSQDPDGRAICAFRYDAIEFARARLGWLLDSGHLSENLRVVSSRESSVDETYSVSVGKTSTVRDQHSALTVELEEKAAPHRKIHLEFKIFDDAFAFRYSLPKQEAIDSFRLLDELTEFSFAGDPTIHAVHLPNYTTSYEGHYTTSSILQLPDKDNLLALPVLLRNSTAAKRPIWFAITEAGLTDHAGAYLSKNSSAKPQESLSIRLSPLPGDSKSTKVVGTTPHSAPWRIVFVGDDPGRFLESNVVFNLNAPSAIEDTSWIQPAKTTFPWWNGYALQGVDFEPGMNTATHKHYIDFCAESGIELHSLDGTDLAWYGGPIVPDGPTDVTTGIAGLDVPELFRYARAKGVRLRLWTHWKALKPQLDEALAAYASWGAEGIMVDFMDRDDQEMVAFYHEVARKAAAHELTVTLHGSYKPTGMERTWPNVMNYESALNQEYNKWDLLGTPPTHNLNVAFIRMIAGPLDYHVGGMRHVQPESYTPEYRAPSVQGTRAHQLAMYVVYQNHLPMLVDSPDAYRGQVGLDFLADVPVTWDETRVLHAAFGECIVIARRSGDSWYLGGMNGDEARTLRLPLTFLDDAASGRGVFEARWFTDMEQEPPSRTLIRTGSFSSSDKLEIHLAAGGGFAGSWTRR